jgi:small subunit ribosomal protein S9
MEPFEITNESLKTFDVTVLVKGGGVTGQRDAIQLGVARALLKINPDLKPVLRKGGLLTRDARIKERKKPGLKRARKAPTYTKR